MGRGGDAASNRAMAYRVRQRSGLDEIAGANGDFMPGKRQRRCETRAHIARSDDCDFHFRSPC